MVLAIRCGVAELNWGFRAAVTRPVFPAVLTELGRLIQGDVNIGVRCAALRALGSVSSDVTIDTAGLHRILKFERNDEVVLAAIRTCGELLQADAENAPITAALYGRTKSSDSMPVRLAATVALGLSGGLPKDQEAAEQQKTIQAALSVMCTHEFTLKRITDQSKQQHRADFFGSLQA